MRLAIVGRGRMGAAIRSVARELGHDVVLEIDTKSPLVGGPTSSALGDVEVALDFTTPHAVVDNLRVLAEAQVSVVVGTTGWHQELDVVRELAGTHGIGVVYAANFSIGANVLLQAVRRAAALLSEMPEFDAYVLEHHHRNKVDAPSGTALSLASAIVDESETKDRIVAGTPEGRLDASALHVASVRAGYVFGRHVVGFDGPSDLVELTHLAKGREGFARGALKAAEWVRGRRGVFEFQSVLEREGKEGT